MLLAPRVTPGLTITVFALNVVFDAIVSDELAIVFPPDSVEHTRVFDPNLPITNPVPVVIAPLAELFAVTISVLARSIRLLHFTIHA
jgi:hypothetical protein